MPIVSIYLSEEEYARLAIMAMQKRIRVSLLARQAVQAMLREALKEMKAVE
jgi:predicted transcriptional regulator